MSKNDLAHRRLVCAQGQLAIAPALPLRLEADLMAHTHRSGSLQGLVKPIAPVASELAMWGPCLRDSTAQPAVRSSVPSSAARAARHKLDCKA